MSEKIKTLIINWEGQPGLDNFMPKVSIIILTYNSSLYILELIESLKKLNSNFTELEIIVVDNASTDDTLLKISNFPPIRRAGKYPISNFKLIKNEKNFGFAAGINSGSKAAKGEYLLFINPDTKFEKGNISDLLSVFEKFENVGIVGGKLIDKEGKAEKSAGKIFGLAEIILISLGLDEQFGVRTSPEKTKKVGFVSGGFMMIKREVFEKLKGFDENFFMYVEDVDFCKRAKKIGFDTYFTPEVCLTHFSHGSSSKSFAIEQIYKSIFYYTKKHGNILTFLFVWLLLKLKALLLVIIGAIFNNSLMQTYSKALRV